MRNIQEIFDVVISEGYYAAHTTFLRSSRFMCHALDWAVEGMEISAEEANYAADEILDYLKPTKSNSLIFAMRISELVPLHPLTNEEQYEITLPVYLDWDNRPELLSNQ